MTRCNQYSNHYLLDAQLAVGLNKGPDWGGDAQAGPHWRNARFPDAMRVNGLHRRGLADQNTVVKCLPHLRPSRGDGRRPTRPLGRRPDPNR